MGQCDRTMGAYEHASGSFAWRADASIARIHVDSDLKAAYEEVRAGKGVAIIRGLPVDGTLEQFSAAVWEVGRHFGAALSQNAQGELVGHVIDATADDPTPRMEDRTLLQCAVPGTGSD